MTPIGSIRGKRRTTSLVVDDSVRFGFWRIERTRRGVTVYASAESWGAHAARNVAAAGRPGSVPQ